MTHEIDQLIADVIAATGAAPPDLLADDSPGLSIAADEPIYLIGLIGGKDVGKSSLINALVGLPISAASASGPGTETVIAYAHSSAADELEAMLIRIVPDKFSIVTHDNPALLRQVLLDLPDIDSIYADHLETTRRMLRHMLYPLWLQSVEKYADRQPQQLLARVAEGNDPRNFLFAVNKIDLLADREGPSAAAELCGDFAARIARTLRLADPPPVFGISSLRPEKFDLPKLSHILARPRSDDEVRASHQLARRRRGRTLLLWLEDQSLAAKAQSAGRLMDQAGEIVGERLAAPILESALPQLLDDPGYRAELTAPAVRKRLSRWPVVGAINTVLAPLLGLVQKNLSATGGAPPIDAILGDDANPLPQRIASAFAHLHRLHPEISELYGDAKPWDEPSALHAAGNLRERFRGVAQRQKRVMLDRAGGTTGLIAPIIRVVLTVGAILWFPIVQPILHALLGVVTIGSWADLARLIVEILGAGHLLRASAFLVIWFAALWLILRWDAQRRADALLTKWRDGSGDDPEISFSAQTVAWLDSLLAPIRRRAQALGDLTRREQAVRARSQIHREAA